MSNEVCAWINIVAFWIERVQAISSMEIWPMRWQNPVSINKSEPKKKNQLESRIQKETTNRLHRYKIFILWNDQCFGLVFWLWFTWHVEWSVSLCSLVSAFHRMKILYRWSRLVVSFCILLSNWFFLRWEAHYVYSLCI
jgi:hypothetical protein